MASNAGPSALLEGTPYEGETILGEGGMGLVIESRHKGLGRRVAVKLLHADLANEEGLVDRLRIEGQLLAQLASPYLVRVSDAGVTPRGDVYIVMERLFGRSLADELKAHGAIPWSHAVHYVRDALRGLEVVHRAGVVHRDIKPANLFLSEENDQRICKVLDFGIAKIIDGPTRAFALPIQPTAPGMVVGSPRYMSPEQARGEKIDARSDVYSMGAVLFALLAGRGPFDDQKGFVDYCKAHAVVPPPPLSRFIKEPIPKELEVVVMKALAKKREDRFASAEAFVFALDAVLALPRDHQVVEPALARRSNAEAVRGVEMPPRSVEPPASPAPAGESPVAQSGLADVERDDDTLPFYFRALLFIFAFTFGMFCSALAVTVLKWWHVW